MGIALKDIIGWAIVLALSAGGSYTAATKSNAATISKIQDDGQAISVRVARLEEAISTLKTDQSEIKQDVKSILKALR